ncbi:MAG: vWA domain-containing protein, partial [Candidatus Kariarchaeaceae archaeon]
YQFNIDQSEEGKIVLQKLAYAKAGVLLDYPFFGYIVGKLNVVATADDSVDKYCVDFSNFYFSTNYVNNVCDIDLNWKERLKGDLIHLILHLIYDHVKRKENRDDKIWGFAADIVVYQMMKELSFQMETFDSWAIPSFSQIPLELLNISTEKVYFLILENLENEKNEDPASRQQGSEENHEINRVNMALNNLENRKEYPNPVNISNFSTSICELHQISFSSSKPSELELSHSLINGILRDAYERSKDRGELPSGIVRYINNKFGSKQNWRSKLSNYLQKVIGVDTTWRTPNKRHIANGIYFPSTYKENVQLLIAIDTSGSIDKIDLEKFMAEIQMIMNQISNVKIILVECDAEIQSIKYIEAGENIKINNLKGGGGTDFRPVFDLREQYDLDLIIYFTDGDGVFPEKSILDIPVLWILTKEFPMPFGNVIFL